MSSSDSPEYHYPAIMRDKYSRLLKDPLTREMVLNDLYHSIMGRTYAPLEYMEAKDEERFEKYLVNLIRNIESKREKKRD